ncbi:MAG: polysaccharide biosynthesis C-terminal domain-containing protein [bacterium]
MNKKIYKNKYIFSLATKAIIVLFAILNSVFINRYLGPSLKGEYAYILNIINLAVLFLNMGIYQSYPYYKREKVEDIKDKYFNLFLFQFILFIIISLVLSLIYSNAQYTIIYTLIPLMVLVNQLNFITMIENINLRNKISIVNQAFYTILLFLVFLFAEKNYIYIFVILYIKDIILIIMFIRRFNFKLRLKNLDFSLLTKSIKFGIFPMLTLLLITMNYKVDVIILEMFVDFEQLGYYTVGVGLANQIWVIPDAFKEVLFSKTASEDSISDIVLSIKTNLYISFAIILSIILLGKPVISFLFGVEFLPSYEVTIILFIGIIPMIFFKLIYTLFIAKGKQKESFIILFISVLLNIIFNFIFIPKFGIIGAALTSVMSYSLCGISFLYIFMKGYNINIKDIIYLKAEEIQRLKFYRKK